MFRQLSETQILAWADAYREATGQWPNKKSGPIAGTVCETWVGVDRALRLGLLGLPGGTTLAQLLTEHRGARYACSTPALSEEQILAWADAHHQLTGEWPTGSGPVRDVPFERWPTIDEALRSGGRGLPGGSSLARLLAERRGARNPAELPPLTKAQILAWADAFHEQTGKWPSQHSGLIPDSGGETWCAVQVALWAGKRGLPGGSSLARLLAAERGARNKANLPDLDVPTVLAWADAHFQRTGKWPGARSGPIPEAPGETWLRVDTVLVRGGRGLPGGTTLAQLLAAQRGRRNHMALPRLRCRQILTWADAYFGRTGNWPTADSGPVPESPGETWLRVETALRNGRRGLRGGSSLAQLLARHRAKRNPKDLPPLRVKQILAWAEAYRERTGRWPTADSGAIPEAPGESWSKVDTALHDGLRNQPGGKSLARLLAQKRGVRNIKGLPPLSVGDILLWADRYREQTGSWPTHRSGPIPGTVGESWLTVDEALRKGARGLPEGSSLARLLAEHRGKRNQTRPPHLTLENIRAWAEAHRRATGRWPTRNSGPIADAPGETWSAVYYALWEGGRGLPGGSTLARFLSEPSGVPAEEETGKECEDVHPAEATAHEETCK